MAKGTSATLELQKAGVAFTLHEYDDDPNAERIGMQAAGRRGLQVELAPSDLIRILNAAAAALT